MTEPFETCPSTFIVPGERRVRRCVGRRNHDGVMHAGDGAAWGDAAAADNHPAEPLVVRTSQLSEVTRIYAEVVRAVAVLHENSDGTCDQCGGRWPCATAVVLGLHRWHPRPGLVEWGNLFRDSAPGDDADREAGTTDG